MPTSGPHNASVFANDAGNGATTDWLNPANAQASDNLYASTSPFGTGGGRLMRRLAATSVSGFSDIADDAVVSQILVEVERVANDGVSGGALDNEAALIVGGVVQDDNQSQVGHWPLVEGYASYAFAVNLTGAQVKAADFGFALGAVEISVGTAQVDHIRFTATYAEVAGELSAAIENLRQSVAGSAAFQSLVGAADSAEALQRVHVTALPRPTQGGKFSREELEDLRPYALIYFDENSGVTFEKDAAGESDEFGTRHGRMHLELARDVPAELANDLSAAELDWIRVVDAIIEDLMDLSGVAGHLSFNRLLTEGPGRNHPNRIPTEGDCQMMMLHFEYSGGTT